MHQHFLLTAHGGRGHAVSGHEARGSSANVLLSGDGGGGLQCSRDEGAVVADHLHTVGAVAAAFRLDIFILIRKLYASGNHTLHWHYPHPDHARSNVGRA